MNGYVLSGFALALALLAVPGAEAQARYPTAPGYVVTVQGDTLRGELAVLPGVLSSTQVRFEAASGGTPVRYGVYDLLGYGFDPGRRYVRRLLRPDDEVAPRLLFVLTLVEGGLSLYALDYDERHETETVWDRQPGTRRYAIEDASGALRPLYERTERVTVDDRRGRLLDRQYVRALAVAFADCPAEQARVAHLPFRQRELTEAVLRYNACVGAPATAAPALHVSRRSDITVGFRVRMGTGPAAVHSSRFQEPATGSAFAIGAGVVLRPGVLSPGLAVPLEAFAGSVLLDDGWRSGLFETSDFDGVRVGLGVGLRQAVALAGVEPFAGVGLQSARTVGKEPRLIGTPGGLVWPFERPHWESGVYAEAGVSGPRGPLSRVSAGVRHERTGLGHPNPLTRSRATWQRRATSGVLTYRF